MQNNAKTIEILNDLIQINNDRITGYERAIKETKAEDGDLKVVFASMISKSHKINIALATEVQALGATAEQGTTTSGKIYRAWTDVKAIFSGYDRHSVLENCEAGEDAAQRAYDTALEHEELPAFIQEMLIDQQLDLKDSHDEIKSLRDQYA